MSFTPDSETLFYAQCTFSRVETHGHGDTTVIERIRDRSYQDCIFRAITHDDRLLVADLVHEPGYGSTLRKTFLRSEWRFEPVGAEVAYSLGLVP